MKPYIALLILFVLIFGVCFGIDKLFTKLFRSKVQHSSGLSVRLNKRLGSFGLVVAVLGIAGAFSGLSVNWLLFAGGCVLTVVGIGMVVYYLSFGIYYDQDSFVYSTFGKKTKQYRYGDIQTQLLYTSAGGVLVELHMNDGNAIQLQPSMVGGYAFLDKAFEGWLVQKGKTLEECSFHDPANSCWFPPAQS